MTEFYAYTHRRPDGAVFYVGAGTRRRAYKINNRSEAHKQIVAECGGKQNIIVMLTPCDTREQAFASEIALIAHYRAVGEPLVNRSSGGACGCAGVACTAETRAKKSAAHKGKTHSVETRAKLSAAHNGKTLSDETRAKIGAAHTGKSVSVETRARMSAAQRGEKNPNFGKTFSAEARAKMSAAQSGKTHSAEARAKMSAAHTGKTHSDETRAKISAAHKAYWAARREGGAS